MTRLRGRGASPGIAVGRAVVLVRDARHVRYRLSTSGVDRERQRLRAARLRSRRQLEDISSRMSRTVGQAQAAIFAAQMLNFPVAGGTSGHLVGAALAFIVLGPWLGLLVMTAVIALQALLFQDGGLIVMGANILVMGIVPGFVGYGVYRLAVNRSKSIKLAMAGVGAWLSVVAAALVTALLLAFSGTANLSVVVPVMVETYVSGLLDRDEFRRHCDLCETKEEILKYL